MTKTLSDIRFPHRARTLDEVGQLVEQTPPWSRGKFRVEFEGRTLDYESALALVTRRKNAPW